MRTAQCAWPVCQNGAEIRGYCHTHYKAAVRSGRLKITRTAYHRLDQAIEHAEAAIEARLGTTEAASQYGYARWDSLRTALIRRGREDLVHAIKANGRTSIHKDRPKPAPLTCKLATCETPVQALGYCDKHYHRYLRTGDPENESWGGHPQPTPCKAEGCSRPHWAKGYCRRHYEADRNTGHPFGTAEPGKARNKYGDTKRFSPAHTKEETSRAAQWREDFEASRRARGIPAEGTTTEQGVKR